METLIKNIEKNIKSLNKEKSKHDLNYRKNKDGYSYGMVCEIGVLIQEMEQQIDKIKNLQNSKPLY